VFGHSDQSGVYTVQFRRRQGDAVQFRLLFSNIRAQLIDTVQFTDHEVEEQSTAPAAAVASSS